MCALCFKKKWRRAEIARSLKILRPILKNVANPRMICESICIMKKLVLIAFSAVALLLGACSTYVLVDSADYPMAEYDDMTGNFEGKLKTNINTAFKATNLALEKDLQYFRVGQIPGDNSWRIFARTVLDYEIVVNLRQEKSGDVSVVISFGDGNLMKSQQIFNEIAKNVRALERQ